MLSLLLQDVGDGAGPHNAAYFFGYMGAAFALIFASALSVSYTERRGRVCCVGVRGGAGGEGGGGVGGFGEAEACEGRRGYRYSLG